MKHTNDPAYDAYPTPLARRLAPSACALLLLVMTGALFAMKLYAVARQAEISLLTSTVFEWVVFFIPAAMVVLLSGAALPRKRLGAKRTLLVIGMGVTGYCFAGLLTAPWTLITTGLSQSRLPSTLTDQGMLSDTPLWVLLLVIALTPAICEEFFFRGMLQRSMSFYPAGAICITAALFALMHFDITKLFGTFALGLFIGWVVMRTDNLTAGMLLHFSNNAIAICVLKGVAMLTQRFGGTIDPDALTRMLESSPALLQQTSIALVSFFALFLLSIPLFILFLTLFLRDTRRDAAALRDTGYQTGERIGAFPAVMFLLCGVGMFAATLYFGGIISLPF